MSNFFSCNSKDESMALVQSLDAWTKAKAHDMTPQRPPTMS